MRAVPDDPDVGGLNGSMRPPTVRVGVLGDVRVWDDAGGEVALAPQLRRLLGLLVTANGSAVPLDRIAHHVTDGRTDGSVIRTAVSRLRRALGDRISTGPAGYRLRLTTGELDATWFLDELAGSQKMPPPERVAALEAALAIWRGHAFEGYEDEPWAVPFVARLEEARATATEALADAYRLAGRHQDAITLLRPHLEQHRHRERTVAVLMLALAAAGRRDDALGEYERLRLALRDDLGLQPSSELRELEMRLLAGGPEPAEARTPHRIGTLPVPPTTFVGRRRELKQLAEGLSSHRLVTLVGPGGVGKTRLALEVANAASTDDFPGGVWMVELAGVVDPSAVTHTVLSAIEGRADLLVPPLDAITDALRGPTALLVLDNAEHVVDEVASLVIAIRRDSDARVVVTSRQPLGVAHEHVHLVPTLDAFDSVELFCERAREADDSFEHDDDGRSVIERLCQRLDGLPLAIELAAARMRSTSPTDLLARLDDTFRVLGRAGAVDRHGTLHSTIAWSHQLLEPHEQLLFARASVFMGGFDRRSLEVVCEGLLPELLIDDVLASLVDRSMIVADHRAPVTRYRLLETIRQFGLEQLAAAGELSDARTRHLARFARTASRINQLHADDPRAAARLLDLEWDNLRAAFDWALATDDLDRAADIAIGLNVTTSLCRDEHVHWLLAVLERIPPDHPSTPWLHCFAGWWANLLGDHRSALQHAYAGLEVVDARRPRQRRLLMVVVTEALVHLGEPETALASADEMLALCDTALDKGNGLMLAVWSAWGCRPDLVSHYAHRLAELAAVTGRLEDQYQALYCAAVAALVEGNAPVAITYFRAARQRADGVRMWELEALQGLTIAAAAANDDETPAAFRAAIEELSGERAWAHLWMVLEGYAIHLADVGQFEPAARLLGALDGHRRASVFLVEGRRRAIAATSSLEQLGAEGRTMDRAGVVEYALATLEQIPPQRRGYRDAGT